MTDQHAANIVIIVCMIFAVAASIIISIGHLLETRIREANRLIEAAQPKPPTVCFVVFDPETFDMKNVGPATPRNSVSFVNSTLHIAWFLESDAARIVESAARRVEEIKVQKLSEKGSKP